MIKYLLYISIASFLIGFLYNVLHAIDWTSLYTWLLRTFTWANIKEFFKYYFFDALLVFGLCGTVFFGIIYGISQ